MLLKKQTTPQINYLENWPAHYYEIKTADQRKEFLKNAIAQNLDPKHDHYRMELLKKRFRKKNTDSFILAWLMLNAAASNNFFPGKLQTREFIGYLEDLCLYNYTPENDAHQQVLTEEWTDFAKSYLLSCISCKNYCSTFFSIVPLKDSAVAQKLVEEIDLITRIYPSKINMENYLFPLRQIFISTYCQLIEDGETYWRNFPS